MNTYYGIVKVYYFNISNKFRDDGLKQLMINQYQINFNIIKKVYKFKFNFFSL